MKFPKNQPDEEFMGYSYRDERGRRPEMDGLQKFMQIQSHVREHKNGDVPLRKTTWYYHLKKEELPASQTKPVAGVVRKQY